MMQAGGDARDDQQLDPGAEVGVHGGARAVTVGVEAEVDQRRWRDRGWIAAGFCRVPLDLLPADEKTVDAAAGAADVAITKAGGAFEDGVGATAEPQRERG